MEGMEFIKIPLVGIRGEGKFTLVDGDYDGEYFSLYRWSVNPAGYVIRSTSVHDEGGKRSIYLHSLVLPPKAGFDADHINRNKLDNRSCNLRYVTRQQNTRNRVGRKNQHGYKGVVQQKGSTKYVCYFRHVYKGTFDTAIEAAREWDKHARKEYGEYGIYNFPK